MRKLKIPGEPQSRYQHQVGPAMVPHKSLLVWRCRISVGHFDLNFTGSRPPVARDIRYVPLVNSPNKVESTFAAIDLFL